MGDIRFEGLLGGIELVSDRRSKTPLAARTMARVKRELLDRGLLVTISGPLRNVVRIQPPLNIQRAQIEALLGPLWEGVTAACL